MIPIKKELLRKMPLQKIIEYLIDSSPLFSNPPPGKFVVKNIYVDPVTGKAVIQYDDDGNIKNTILDKEE